MFFEDPLNLTDIFVLVTDYGLQCRKDMKIVLISMKLLRLCLGLTYRLCTAQKSKSYVGSPNRFPARIRP